MKEWTKERCSEEPQELQLVADGIYIQRKNIEKMCIRDRCMRTETTP